MYESEQIWTMNVAVDGYQWVTVMNTAMNTQACRSVEFFG
jgi:hypothetical protein